MGLLTHVVLFAAYALGAAAVAFGLPDAAPEVGAHLAYALGGCVFLAAALLHEVMARRVNQSDMNESVQEARRITLDLERDIDNIREDVALLGGTGAGIIAGDGTSHADLVQEMRVLQSLVSELERGARGGGPQSQSHPQSGSESDEETAPPASIAEARAPEPALSVDRAETSVVAAPGPADRQATAASGAQRLPARRRHRPRPVLTGLSQGEILDITRAALRDNRVDLYLQPIVALPQRQARFYEAFSRIRNESGDLILPDQYIPLAAEAGLISTIDNLLLFRCIQLVRRTERASNDAGFFCNISSSSIKDAEFFPQFLEFMQNNQQLAKRLLFELSEADLRTPGIVEPLARLTALNFGLSIDHASDLSVDFAELADRNVKFVKIGVSHFLAEAGDTGAALVARIKSHRIDVIVDRFEEENSVLGLLEANVSYAQGFLFGEPRPSPESAG